VSHNVSHAPILPQREVYTDTDGLFAPFDCVEDAVRLGVLPQHPWPALSEGYAWAWW
jgi:hypothetical protein